MDNTRDAQRQPGEQRERELHAGLARLFGRSMPAPVQGTASGPPPQPPATAAQPLGSNQGGSQTAGGQVGRPSCTKSGSQCGVHDACVPIFLLGLCVG